MAMIAWTASDDRDRLGRSLAHELRPTIGYRKKKAFALDGVEKQTDPYFADFVNSVTASEAFNSTASESAPGIGASDFAESCRTSTSPIVGSLTSLWTTEISAPGNFDSMKLCNCSRWAYPSGTSMVIWNPSNTSRLSSRQGRCAMLTAAKISQETDSRTFAPGRIPISVGLAALQDRHRMPLQSFAHQGS